MSELPVGKKHLINHGEMLQKKISLKEYYYVSFSIGNEI